MEKDSTLPELELMAAGGPMRNLAEALQTGFFQGGTLDLFYHDRHLRIKNLYLVVQGNSVRPDPHKSNMEILQQRKGIWKRARNQTIDLYLNMHAIPIAMHDSGGRLMFVTLKHTTNEGKTAQFVLYRSGRDPEPGDLHIIDWPIGLNPMIGTGAANQNT